MAAVLWRQSPQCGVQVYNTRNHFQTDILRVTSVMMSFTREVEWVWEPEWQFLDNVMGRPLNVCGGGSGGETIKCL